MTLVARGIANHGNDSASQRSAPRNIRKYLLPPVNVTKPKSALFE
jgi:hypothetical protein